ncbi:PDZ and LIM domain protein 2 [Caerostris extrusa]|uniref:PDZ and LIM domain protein 2 n=1 Tax=Caerostris extrusa TaxID=172846 RepID=A0AAV4NUL8_CAEEX|nr:PDZ and LIM domain protein 2 [Caerostris extrusa]
MDLVCPSSKYFYFGLVYRIGVVPLYPPGHVLKMNSSFKRGSNMHYILQVNSKGREQGLKEGDRVLSVNGQPTAEMTHADAQRVIREASSSIELQIERNTAASETNGFDTTRNGNMSEGQITEAKLSALDEEANHTGSWSTDSTSTGSTTILVSSLNSDDTSASESENNEKRSHLILQIHVYVFVVDKYWPHFDLMFVRCIGDYVSECDKISCSAEILTKKKNAESLEIS